MSQSHLNQLYAALTQRGWKITEWLRGEINVEGCATWEVHRQAGGPVILIDFAGFGGLGEDIELDNSYACEVRGHAIDLYFYRVNRSRERWSADLSAFVAALDRIGEG